MRRVTSSESAEWFSSRSEEKGIETPFLPTAPVVLRQVVYEGLREDKPAVEVRRSPPNPIPATAKRG